MTDLKPNQEDIALDILRENFAHDPFEKYGPAGSDIPKESVMINTDARIDELEEVLRSLASYVGAGGYNADEVDPKVFEDKIRWGIDNLLGVNHVGKLEAKIRELEVRLGKAHEMASDCRESAEHLEKEVSEGRLFGDFKHQKAERAEVLHGCANRLESILSKPEPQD